MTSPEYLTSRACPATEQAFVINNYVTECVAAAQTEKNKQDRDRKKKKRITFSRQFLARKKGSAQNDLGVIKSSQTAQSQLRSGVCSNGGILITVCLLPINPYRQTILSTQCGKTPGTC